MEQRILAHRGASGYAPENTLEAFELALKMGAHGVELDVHLTRDGEVVVAHDETVDRVSDGSGWISQMTLSELKKLHFNKTFPDYAGARIPTLQEVFQLLGPAGMYINIELKNTLIGYPGLEEKCMELVARENLQKQVMFSSFNHYSLLRVKELDPSQYCGLLYEATMINSWEYGAKLHMDALHPHYGEVLIPGTVCQMAHKAGLQVNPWTVNDREDLRRVIRAGADNIISNFPDVALAILQEETEKNR